jgi:putative thiamine transport system substrate-binding protein
VLALDRLSPADRAHFSGADVPGVVREPAPAWPEPHASWVEPIEREWTRRYGV